jgi:hypothetical protein
MTIYTGNFKNDIELVNLLEEVKSSNGDRRVFVDSYFDMTKPGFNIIMDNWQKAGYELSAIEWFNYYSGTQFNESHTTKFGELINAKPVKVWVSEIRPGKCFPYHWDADTNTDSYVEGKMVRYQMFLEDYKPGHYFVMDDCTLTGYKAGDVYMWDDYRVWHAGGNMGFSTKYIFNFLGISLDV